MSSQKVTLIDVLWRILVLIVPFFLPQFFDLGKDGQKVLPFIWAIFFPLVFMYLKPSPNINDWEDEAKPFFWIFKSIGYLILGGVILSGVLYLLIGKTRHF